MSEHQCSVLGKYTACDISDALLFLSPATPGTLTTAGFIPDLTLRRSAHQASTTATTGMLVAPAFTVQFQPKDPSLYAEAQPKGERNIEAGVQWSDLVETGYVAVVQQPEGQRCAVVGGVHMTRLCVKGVAGLIVGGNMRDQRELMGLDLVTFSKGASSVGAAAEAVAWASQVPVLICGVLVEPGDLICLDVVEGVVRIPEGLVQDVVDWLERRGSSEDDVMAAVRAGNPVQSAFAVYRK